MSDVIERVALLPCPLCGSAFKMGQEPRDNGSVAGQFYLYHDYGPLGSAARKCPLTIARHFETRETAIAAWNTRPALQSAGIETLLETLTLLRADLAEEDADLHAQRIAVIDAALTMHRSRS